MTKDELVTQLAEQSDCTKADAERVFDALGDVIRATLSQGGEVALPGLGKFSTSERAARAGRNPATGEAIQIAATTVPKFKAAKALKDAAAGT